MSKEKLIPMRVLRAYSRGHVRHSPGKVIRVPEHVAQAMEQAKPPYGERVSATAATAEEEAASGAAVVPKPQGKPQAREK